MSQLDDLKAQMGINSAMWFNASDAGKDYLHNQNVAIQSQIDALQGSYSTYNAAQGTYETVPIINSPASASRTPDATDTSLYGVQSVAKVGSPNVAVANVVVSPAGLPQQVQTVLNETDSRRAEKAAFTGWDNDSAVRGKQEKAWDIYVSTGRWDSPEQIQLHADAETMRKNLNPTYQGAAWGTADKSAADKLILPMDNFVKSNSIESGVTSVLNGGANSTIGKGVGMLATGGLLLVVLSLFRGGR